MKTNSRLAQDLFPGLIPLHILHHAGEKPFYGLWVIEELGRHGYKLSAGTLYPLLHRLERRGLLRSRTERAGDRVRRVYEITPTGRRALLDAKHKVKELFGELFESELNRVFGEREHRRQQPPRANSPLIKSPTAPKNCVFGSPSRAVRTRLGLLQRTAKPVRRPRAPATGRQGP